MFPIRTAIVLGALGFVYLVAPSGQNQSPAWLVTVATASACVLVLASMVRSAIALMAPADSYYNRGAQITVRLARASASALPGLKRRYLEMRFKEPQSSLHFRFPWKMKNSSISPSLRYIEVLLILARTVPSVLILLIFGGIVGSADVWTPAVGDWALFGQLSSAVIIALGWLIVILSAIDVGLALIDAVFLLFAEGIRAEFANRAHRLGNWLVSLR